MFRWFLVTTMFLFYYVYFINAVQAGGGAENMDVNNWLEGEKAKETIVKMVVAVDQRKWDEVVSYCTEKVYSDYKSITGQEPSVVDAKAMVEGWKGFLPGFKTTQHNISNQIVLKLTPESAEVLSYFNAVHYLPEQGGEPIWVVNGVYIHGLVKECGVWKLNSVKVMANSILGNQNLPTAAQKIADVAKNDAADVMTTEFHSGLNKVEFTSSGCKIAADLYLPENYQADKKLPLIIVTGSWTTVKEQMAGLYARKIADQGYAALAFDFRNFGESGGAIRQFESPAEKIADIKAAAEWVKTLPFVEDDKIGGLGICAGAGYMARAIAEGAAIKSFVTVAAWLHDPQSIAPVYGGQNAVAAKKKDAEQALAQYEKTGVVLYVPAQSGTDPQAAMFGDFDYYSNRDRGAIRAWTNRFAVMSWLGWLNFDSLMAAKNIKVPTLMVHSDGAALPDNVREFYRDLAGEKNLLWTTGTQFDFYDQPLQVGKAIHAAMAHYAENFGVHRAPAAGVVLGNENLEMPKRFLGALERKDLDAFLALWAEDGVQDMPFSPQGFPKSLQGKDAIAKQYGGLPENFEYMKFPLSAVYATQDPNVVIAFYRGDIKIKASGKKYDNDYIGVFHIEKGKIKHFEEYFNPDALAQAFGGALNDNFNVDK